MTIVLVQATITATRFAIEKRPRLRLIRRSRGFDQYTDQYQKISGWTQWTRQLFVPTENGAKSAGKHPIAGLLRPDASSHAGGHWFESSSLHHKKATPDGCGLFCGIRGNLKCSAEVNSASAKVLPAAKRLYGTNAPPCHTASVSFVSTRHPSPWNPKIPGGFCSRHTPRSPSHTGEGSSLSSGRAGRNAFPPRLQGTLQLSKVRCFGRFYR